MLLYEQPMDVIGPLKRTGWVLVHRRVVTRYQIGAEYPSGTSVTTEHVMSD